MIVNTLQSYAVTKYLSISTTKMKNLSNQLQGKTYYNALKLLVLNSTKASFIIWKTLRAAYANFINRISFVNPNIYISTIYTLKGPILKRTRIRAKGKLTVIKKRKSHLVIILKDAFLN